MGFAKVPHELKNHLHELSGSQLKVWLCHLLHENENKQSWPSLYKLSKETGLHQDIVIKARKWLREQGWLKTVTYRDSKTGRFAVPVEECASPWLNSPTDKTSERGNIGTVKHRNGETSAISRYSSKEDTVGEENTNLEELAGMLASSVSPL